MQQQEKPFKRGSNSKRVLLGGWGEPGHLFPILAIAEALSSDGGHEVFVQSALKWQELIESLGLRFVPGHEYSPATPEESWLTPYAAMLQATIDTVPQVTEIRPDVCVSEVFSHSTNFAAESVKVPTASVIPHLDHRHEPDWPPYAFGARRSHNPISKAIWRRFNDVQIKPALQIGIDDVNNVRKAVGLQAIDQPHNAISNDLSLVATVPQLEYPRRKAVKGAHTVGPLIWEPAVEKVEVPAGELPLVAIAPSTSQDPYGFLLKTSIQAVADLPVRAIAASNYSKPVPGQTGNDTFDLPDNVTLVPWMPYSQVFPSADVIICHGGHGTLMRALQYGKPVIIIPIGGDMYENAVRISWARMGISIPPKFMDAQTISAAIMKVLSSKRFTKSTSEAANWIANNDAAAQSAELILKLCR